VNHRLITRTLEAGGTCTGEHGVGRGKAKYMADEHGEGAVGVMRAIKAAFDPRDIMNPGKILMPLP
jgi:D-lactate dehydrogenase (cytochrome)